MAIADEILRQKKEDDEERSFKDHLISLLEDQQKTREDILLEQMVNNEEAEAISLGIDNVSKNINKTIRAFAKLLSNIGPQELMDVRVENFSDMPMISDNGKDIEVTTSVPDVSNNITPIINNEVPTSNPMVITNPNTIPVEVINSLKEIASDLEFQNIEPNIQSNISNDFEMGELPSIRELINQTEDMSEVQALRLKSIDENIEEFVTAYISKMNEDVGGVGGMPEDQDKPEGDDLDLGFLGNLLQMIPGGKALQGMFAPFTKIFGKIASFGKMFGRVAGKAMIPIALAFSVLDFFEGFSDSETVKEITGKDPENLSIIEKTMSGISNVISGLTFGLLDAKSVFETGMALVDGFISVVTNLFDPENGPLGFITKNITDTIDSFQQGEFLDGFLGIFEMMYAIPKQIADMVYDFLPDPIKAFLGKRGNQIDSGVKMAGSLMDSAVDSVGNFFGFGSKEDVPVKKPTIESQDVNVPQGIMKAVIRDNKESISPRPIPIETNSLQLTNDLANENTNQQPQVIEKTIVIPQQQENKKEIIRRTESSDLMLAAVNSTAF